MEDFSIQKLQSMSAEDKQGYSYVLKFLSEHNLTVYIKLISNDIDIILLA